MHPDALRPDYHAFYGFANQPALLNALQTGDNSLWHSLCGGHAEGEKCSPRQLLTGLSFPVRPAMGMSLATGGLGLSAGFILGTAPSVLCAATPFAWIGLQWNRTLGAVSWNTVCNVCR